MPAPSTVTPSASSESVKTVKQTSSPSFIHKLYAMLEEPEMDELIWWHENQTNFFVRPCEEFTKNLSKYFKHANVASFIRQLNMYGFHKVDNSNSHHNNNNSSNVNDHNNSNNANDSNNSSNVNTVKKSSGPNESNESNAADNPNMKDNGNENTSNTNPNIGSVNAEKDNKDEKPTGDKDAGNSSRNLDNNHGQIWEFKHNSGVFRKGNVEGLNSIKRRSFKNTPDKESKLVYDIPPVPYSTTLHNGATNIAVTNSHIAGSSTPENYHHIQQLLLQQQQQQQQQNQQNQHFNRLSFDQNNQRSSIPGQYEFSEDRSTILFQAQISQLEHDRNSLFNHIKDLQAWNHTLQIKFNEMAIKMEEIQKVNDIYREELAHINYDFVTTLDAIRDSCKNQGVLDNVRSKTLQRSAYRDMTFKNLAYQYQGPVQVQGMQNVSNIPNPVPAGPVFHIRNGSYSTLANRNSSTASVSSNPYFTALKRPSTSTSGLGNSNTNVNANVNASTTPNVNTSTISGNTNPPPPGSIPQGSETPFQRDIRYSVSTSSGRTRNPSIYDPLQPLPVQASFYPVDINSLSRQHSLSQVYVTHRKEELDDKKDVKKQKH